MDEAVRDLELESTEAAAEAVLAREHTCLTNRLHI